jgi:hypothetical protein
MARKWKILCLLLFLANLAMAYWLFNTNLDLRSSEREESSGKIELAKNAAEIDFLNGRLCIFEVQLIPPESLGTNKYGKGFTGQKEGPFELWHVIMNSTADRPYLETKMEYYNAYNIRMDSMYLNKDIPKSSPPGVPGPPYFRGGIPVPPWDSHSNFYNCSVEMRVSGTVRLDPLTKYLIVHEKSTVAAYNWLTKKPLPEENSFKVRESSFTILPQLGSQEVVVEPGYHPAQIFRLRFPSPLKAMDWNAWQNPDYV